MHRMLVFSCLVFAAGGGRAWADPRNPAPAFSLSDPGTESVVSYERYGTFLNEGTTQYRFLIRDRAGLAAAVGEGIYPNVDSALNNPVYVKAQSEGKLEGPVWDFVNRDDLQLNFLKWATSREPLGVKQFYSALMLEKAGLYAHAIKAYYACAVHAPKSYGQTFWETPWYIGPTALDHVTFLTRRHPELGLHLEGARIRIKNQYDRNPHNDHFEVSPGRLKAGKPAHGHARDRDFRRQPVRKSIAGPRVKLAQYPNRHWQLLVDGKPLVVRGVSYHPSPVGASPHDASLVVHKDWMLADVNENGKLDGPYDSWVDANRNNQRDPDEKTVGDFALLQAMGVNAIRLYHHGYNKTALKDAYERYGLWVLMGDYLGVYAQGSGATWEMGTDYTDPEQRRRMLESVRKMVEQYREEPYVLMWVLGNENNYGAANNAREHPEVFYALVNEAARLIHSLDPTRPVALSNGDLDFLPFIIEHGSDVDLLGVNAYRGSHGFGDSFWQDLKEQWQKPVLITEFGCPAYHHSNGAAVGEAMQADYLRFNWLDIEYNLAGGPGQGNAIGGVIFEWMDEWWKGGPPPKYDSRVQETIGQFGGPFPDGWSYEEWFGLVSQGDGKYSPFLRQLRPSYFMFKDELWNPKAWKRRGLP